MVRQARSNLVKRQVASGHQSLTLHSAFLDYRDNTSHGIRYFAAKHGVARETLRAAAKGSRTAWRTEQKTIRASKNAHSLEEWEARCRDHESDGTRKPPKPKQTRKEKTPERFLVAIKRAEDLDDEEAARLEVEMSNPEVGAKGKAAALKRQRILDML